VARSDFNNSFTVRVTFSARHTSRTRVDINTFGGFEGWTLYTRNPLVKALTQDYIVAALAKGLGERAVMYEHAFKNILPPIATLITLSNPTIVTEVLIMETIFRLEGNRKRCVKSLNRVTPSYPVAQAALFILATLTTTVNVIPTCHT
jgi:peptide/nickel transport system permease protein